MEEVRCRALFLALFTPMLTTLGNVPRLRARSAHFVSHLPVDTEHIHVFFTFFKFHKCVLCRSIASKRRSVKYVSGLIRDRLGCHEWRVAVERVASRFS